MHPESTATASGVDIPLPPMPLHAVRIPYQIADYSSAARSYLPQNILNDCPSDESSRWTTTVADQRQFITLRLPSPAIVSSILFGKFHKPHVCNLREMRILAGLSPDCMEEIFCGGLENNVTREILTVRFRTSAGTIFPVEYIKIVPQSAHQKEFPYSIWYVEIFGCIDSAIVNPYLANYTEYRRRETLRYCLKFLRENGLKAAFSALQQDSPHQLSLEHPLLSQLYQTLVVDCDFVKSERMVADILALYPSIETTCEPSWAPRWELISSGTDATYFPESCEPATTSEDESSTSPPTTSRTITTAVSTYSVIEYLPKPAKAAKAAAAIGSSMAASLSPARSNLMPGPRGGHHMVIDENERAIYMFGGWSGTKDLADFWRYDIIRGEWTCLSINTAKEPGGGPGARSCHKMVLDPGARKIYLLGRFIDCETRMTRATMPSCDFWRYDIVRNKWKCISRCTVDENGPPLLYDHQMSIDLVRKVIYVFGGRILGNDSATHLYASLYSYDIASRKWRNIRCLAQNANNVNSSDLTSSSVMPAAAATESATTARASSAAARTTQRATASRPSPRPDDSDALPNIIYDESGSESDLEGPEYNYLSNVGALLQNIQLRLQSLAIPPQLLNVGENLSRVLEQVFQREQEGQLQYGHSGYPYSNRVKFGMIQLLNFIYENIREPQLDQENNQRSQGTRFDEVYSKLLEFQSYQEKVLSGRFPTSQNGEFRQQNLQQTNQQQQQQKQPQQQSQQENVLNVLKAFESTWELKPRVGHSMHFSHSMRFLYILGGQCNQFPLPQLLAYDVDKEYLIKMPYYEGIDASITQRAVIDERIDSLILLSTLVPRPGSGTSMLGPALHTYDLSRNLWNRIPCASSDASGTPTPSPRFAYGLVYDSVTQSVFVFGGNPDLRSAPRMRLADFWTLRLRRPNSSDVTRLCTFLIRKQKFNMLCKSHPLHALRYLRSHVAQSVDYSNPIEEREFSKLPSALFTLPSKISPATASVAAGNTAPVILDQVDGAPAVKPMDADDHAALNALYDRITRFFPKEMKQPSGNLVDRINLD